VEQDIFNSKPDLSKVNILKKNVSIIGTDYNKLYSDSGIMPPGSATLINISEAPIYDIMYDAANSTATTLTTKSSSSCVVNYMIQASPAQAGTGGLITQDTVSNSIMNSLILAAQNGAKNVIIPFIGGGIFLNELQRKIGSGYSLVEHARILVKGVTKYFDFVSKQEAAQLNINAKSIETILFCPFNTSKVDEKTPLDTAISAKNHVFNGNCKVNTTNGNMNIINATINQCTKGMKNIAIVNAANVELGFGTGISSMCYAAINKDKKKQDELLDIKTQFVTAYKRYIKGNNYASSYPMASSSRAPASGTTPTVLLPGPASTSSRAPASTSPPLPASGSTSPPKSRPAPPSKSAIQMLEKIDSGVRATVDDFLQAQAGKSEPPVSYTTALKEIQGGQKTTHWIWYIIPSDIHAGSSIMSVFYGIGPNATNSAKQEKVKVLSVDDYLNNNTLRTRYIAIVTEIGKKLISYSYSNGGIQPNDDKARLFLINLMSGETDYAKLTSSVLNFYDKLQAIIGYNNNISVLYETLKYFYDKEPGITPGAAQPPVPPVPPAYVVPKVRTGGARIVTLGQIKTMIVDGSKSSPKSIFLINGGSFNPPHIGHIKTFELAYQRLMQIEQFKSYRVYGIMVVSTRDHIASKKVPENAIISSQDRIQLCQLAADNYKWANSKVFGPNNIFIYDTPDVNPTGTIIHAINTDNMYYLSGSDYYLNTYLRHNSTYNIMYVMRKGDDEAIKKIPYNQNGIQIRPDSSDVAFDLSSSTIRTQIRSLVADDTRTRLQNDILDEVGKGVYCRLQQLKYLVDSRLYGNLCGRGASPPVIIAPPPGVGQPPPQRYLSVPLHNEGGSFCYFNAALQLLFSIDSIRTIIGNGINQQIFNKIISNYNSNSNNKGDECRENCQQILSNSYSILRRMYEQIIKGDYTAKNYGNFKTSIVRSIQGFNLGQQDSQEVLNSILVALKKIPIIQDSICFNFYSVVLCKGLGVRSDYGEYNKTTRDAIKNYNISNINDILYINENTSLALRQDTMLKLDIQQRYTNINECIAGYFDEVRFGGGAPDVRIPVSLTKVCNAQNIRQKQQIFINDGQTYLIIQLKRMSNHGKYITQIIDVTRNNEEITITQNGVQIRFKLRGVICKSGSAGGGHYIYVSMENGRRIIYDDAAPPTEGNISTKFELLTGIEYIMNTRGYVLLYKRVDAAAGDGGGARVRVGVRGGVRGGPPVGGGNITKKNKSSISISVNKKTRKTNNKNNHSPKSPKGLKNHKNKTQHFKIVRNGNNNTRKK
jgi:ubiquitin C-terminal hydrolase/nicotinic acid mononucleotide adenylyltransferase